MGGRFLKRVEGGNDNNAIGGKDFDESSSSNSSSSNNNNNAWWVDVGNIKAREKTSQALREGAPDLRSVSSTGTTSQQESSHSASAVPTDAVSASGGLEAATPSFAAPESSPALARYSTAIPSHVAPSSGKGFPAIPMGHGHKIPMTGGHSLTNHPLFHTLSPYQKHQILMEEVQAAREAAAAAAEFAALRNFHYQRGLQDPFGQGGHNKMFPGQGHMPQAGYEKLGSTTVGNGVSPSLQEKMQLMMNPNHQHPWNGGAVGPNRSLDQNQLKRNAQAASLCLPESFVDTGTEDDNANTICRGPRLKRLKQRRQLEGVRL
jgi:hypothetical protein